MWNSLDNWRCRVCLMIWSRSQGRFWWPFGSQASCIRKCPLISSERNLGKSYHVWRGSQAEGSGGEGGQFAPGRSSEHEWLVLQGVPR